MNEIFFHAILHFFSPWQCFNSSSCGNYNKQMIYDVLYHNYNHKLKRADEA